MERNPKRPRHAGLYRRLSTRFDTPRKFRIDRAAVARFHEEKRRRPIFRDEVELVKDRYVTRRVLDRVLCKHPAQ